MSEDILARLKAAAPRVERIDVDFGPFWMQAISGEMNWQLLMIEEDLKKNGKATIPPPLIIAVALCNEDGSPLHADLSETVKLVSRIERQKMYVLFDHALRVTGLGALAVEAAEKKSLSSQSSESGTSSPS